MPQLSGLFEHFEVLSQLDYQFNIQVFFFSGVLLSILTSVFHLSGLETAHIDSDHNPLVKAQLYGPNCSAREARIFSLPMRKKRNRCGKQKILFLLQCF